MFILLLLTSVVAMRPVYDCPTPCIQGTLNREYVFITLKGETQQIAFQQTSDFDVYFAQKYSTDTFALNTSASHEFSNKSIHLKQMMQVVQYRYLHSVHSSNAFVTIEVSAFVDMRWSVVPSEKSVSSVELLALPIDMAHFHGNYWSQRYYYYVFFTVASVLSVLLIVLLRATFYSALIIVAAYAFLAAFATKLYHYVVSVMMGYRDANQLALGIAVIGVCVELLPVMYCCLVYTYQFKYPFVFAPVTAIVAIALSFIGSGYYVGSGLLLFYALSLSIKKITNVVLYKVK